MRSVHGLGNSTAGSEESRASGDRDRHRRDDARGMGFGRSTGILHPRSQVYRSNPRDGGKTAAATDASSSNENTVCDKSSPLPKLSYKIPKPAAVP